MSVQHAADIKTRKPQVVRITDMTDYQKGSIVSREVIKTKAGSVTLFAFDKDERLSEHIVPFDAMAYIVEGEAEIVISGKPYVVGKDEMVVMPAREPHALKALKKFKMVLTMIRKDA